MEEQPDYLKQGSFYWILLVLHPMASNRLYKFEYWDRLPAFQMYAWLENIPTPPTLLQALHLRAGRTAAGLCWNQILLHDAT